MLIKLYHFLLIPTFGNYLIIGAFAKLMHCKDLNALIKYNRAQAYAIRSLISCN